MNDVRRISIMGATGSIGRSALSVVETSQQAGAGIRFEVEALCAHSNVAELAQAARRVGARLAVIADESRLGELEAALAGSGIPAAAGEAACIEAAQRPVDRVLAAIVGSAGLRSTLAALSVGNDVALANKESIVCAGEVMLAQARRTGARIIPVDSEHNAIFQVLDTGRRPESLIITASGGPFRSATSEAMRTATPAQAAAHPNWSMGMKNSIDSATLMNKALELIEASYLFAMPEDRIEVLVHPQSIIHGMVRYPDGSVLAQLGTADMRTPIAHALSWPDGIRTEVARLDFAALSRLDFEPVDAARFGAIALARQAARHGCLASTVLNCANEVAVAAFVAGKCGFLDITWAVAETLERFCDGRFGDHHDDATSLDCVLALDRAARNVAEELLGVRVAS